MGLDMVLVGASLSKTSDKCHSIRFGMWRKHWRLHTYIVNQFAGGMEKYYETHFLTIKLSEADLRKVIAALESGEVPPQPVPGVRPSDLSPEPDLLIFQEALAWVASAKENHEVYYHGND